MSSRRLCKLVDLIKLLREGALFKRLSDPLHLGKSTVQECTFYVQEGREKESINEVGSSPISDVLYTFLRPFNIRHYKGAWYILLPPSYCLYQVKHMDHKRKIIEVEPKRGLQIEYEFGQNEFEYMPYYFEHMLKYQYDSDVEYACIPKQVTYLKLDLLPDPQRPLLYLLYRKFDHGGGILSAIFLSRPKSRKTVPVTYTDDCSFIWIGVTIKDLQKLGFKEPPINYTVFIKWKRSIQRIIPLKKYTYEDLQRNTSVVRVFKSYAVVKTYIEESATPTLHLLYNNVALGLRLCRLSGLDFTKVLLGSRLKLRKAFLVSTTPIVYVSIGEKDRKTRGIGVKIIRSEGLGILFEKEKFEKIIEGILYRNVRVLKTLLLKNLLVRYFYSRQEDYYDFSGMAEELLNLAMGEEHLMALKRYSTILYSNDPVEIISYLKKINEYENFRDYTIKVALYSLAQVLLKVLTHHVLKTKLGNFTVYVKTDYKVEDKEYYAIMILENSHEGLGFIEYLHSLISEGNLTLDNIVELALNMLVNDKTNKTLCQEHFERCKLANQPIVERMCGGNKDLQKLRKYLQELLQNWSAKLDIDFPCDLMRHMLLKYLSIVDKDLRRKLTKDTFLRNAAPLVYTTEVPFCWDGCFRCVRIRTPPYTLLPIEQIFYTSRDLAISILHLMKDALTSRDTKTIVKLGTGLGHAILNYLQKANNEVRIMSPWISPSIAMQLIDLAKTKNVKIRILTRPPSDTEPYPHQKALSLLSKASMETKNIEVRYSERVHAKVMIINGEMLITGSMNLTRSGTEINIENVTIIRDKSTIYSIIASFEKEWYKSTHNR